MAAEKVTVMVLKVDLQCPSCYRKTKRTLCKFPQVRDQIYDEKGNTVTITVVCCSPERIRDKLCCRGGKAIKSIEIKDHAAKPKQADKPKEPEKPKQADKPKEAEKPKEQDKPKATEKKVTIVEPNPAPAAKPKEMEKPKEAAAKPKDMEKPKPENNNKPKPNGQAPPAEKPVEKPKETQPAKPAGGPGPGPVMIPLPAQQMKGPEPMAHGVPSVFPYVGPSYDGYGAGPYYQGYGYPAPPPQPCYEGYYGHGQAQQGYNGYGNGYGYGRIANVNRNDHYFSEEEPQSCSIM